MIVGARRSQPYRKKGGVARGASPTLAAMKRGRPAFGRNPMDVQRATQRLARRRRRGRGALAKRLG